MSELQYWSASRGRYYRIGEMAGPHMKNAYLKLLQLKDEFDPNYDHKEGLLNALKAEMSIIGMDLSGLP